MYKYPLSQLRSKKITDEDVVFIYAMTKKREKTSYDRREGLKRAGFIFNPSLKEWGGWITNLKDGKKVIDKLLDMNFFTVGVNGLISDTKLVEQLEDYEEEIN